MNYKPDRIFSIDKIKKIENYKVKYKHIIRKLTLKQKKDMLDRFTVNFTYETNAIEGNSLALKDVTLILHENTVPKDSNLRDVYETRNTRIAIDLLFNKKIKITEKDIINLHSILVKDTGISQGYKTLPNFILMRDVKTTDPENVEKEMKKLIADYHNKKHQTHPLRLTAEFHARFEKIHPFEDGNGRVGRILINAILLDLGYPQLIIRRTMRISYFNALEAYDNAHKDKLERFMIEKYEQTFKKFFEIYVKYLPASIST